MSSEVEEKLYFYAYSLYSACDPHATEAFEALCGQNGRDPRFWAGLAASLQQEGNYQRALASWEMVMTIDPNYPDAQLHAAECCLSIGAKEKAKIMLEQASATSERTKLLFQRNFQ